MDVTQKQVDDLVSELKERGRGSAYILPTRPVLLLTLTSLEPPSPPSETRHNEAVLHEAVKQKKLKKIKQSDLGTVSGRKLSDDDCYIIAEES